MVTTGTAVGADYGRLAGTFGILSAVLIAVSIIVSFASGAPPALDDPAQKVLNYYKGNEGIVKLGGFLGFLALGTVPIWFLGVYSALRDRGTAASESWPRLSLVSLIVTGAFVGAQGAVVLALGLGASDEFEGSPGVAGALFDLYNALGAAIAIVFTVFLIATGVALARTGAYPNWWSTLLYVGGVASLISFLAPFTEMDVLAFFGLLAILTLIVFAAVSGLAMQKGTAAAPRSPTL